MLLQEKKIFKKRFVKGIKIYLKKRKTKSVNMLAKYIEIFEEKTQKVI